MVTMGTQHLVRIQGDTKMVVGTVRWKALGSIPVEVVDGGGNDGDAALGSIPG